MPNQLQGRLLAKKRAADTIRFYEQKIRQLAFTCQRLRVAGIANI